MAVADPVMIMPTAVDGGVMVVASRRRNRDAVALIGALVPVAGSVWIVREIRSSDNPVNSATVWAAYVAVATLLVTLLTYLLRWWWKGRRATAMPATAVQIGTAADQLAQRMPNAWQQEATERGITTPAPVKVQWQWGPAQVRIRAADRWCRVSISDLERDQLTILRTELGLDPPQPTPITANQPTQRHRHMISRPPIYRTPRT